LASRPAGQYVSRPEITGSTVATVLIEPFCEPHWRIVLRRGTAGWEGSAEQSGDIVLCDEQRR